MRHIETKVGVKMETFEPTMWIIVKRGDIPVLVETVTLNIQGDYLIDNPIDTSLGWINTMLVEAGEPPLSTEEIFYYKLTKEN